MLNYNEGFFIIWKHYHIEMELLEFLKQNITISTYWSLQSRSYYTRLHLFVQQPAEPGKYTCGRIIHEIGVWLKFHCAFHTFLYSVSVNRAFDIYIYCNSCKSHFTRLIISTVIDRYYYMQQDLFSKCNSWSVYADDEFNSLTRFVDNNWQLKIYCSASYLLVNLWDMQTSVSELF